MFGAFLPSLPGWRRNADLGINTKPDSRRRRPDSATSARHESRGGSVHKHEAMTGARYRVRESRHGARVPAAVVWIAAVVLRPTGTREAEVLPIQTLFMFRLRVGVPSKPCRGVTRAAYRA